MLQYFIIQCLFYYVSSGRLREVKEKRKFQTFRPKSGRGHIREVVATSGSSAFKSERLLYKAADKIYTYLKCKPPPFLNS